MSQIIHIDYENTRQQANELQKVVSEYDDIRRSFQSMLSSIPEVWNGDAANAYLDLLVKKLGELGELQSDTEKLSALMLTIADQFEEAEMRLKAEIQQSGTSFGSSSSYGGGGRGF